MCLKTHRQMNRLGKVQTLVLRLGGVLVLLGAVLNPVETRVASYVYCLGALMFASMQMAGRYEGGSFVIRRLRRQQLTGAVLLMLSGGAMFGNAFGVEYMRHNEWLLIMLVAAILELYTAFRIPAEMEKERRNNEKPDTSK